MATLKYDGIEYNVVYVDPSIAEEGDGATVSTSLKNFPQTLVNKTCYIIRRTSEEYKVDIKPTNNTGLEYILFLGMPKNDSIFYDLMEEDVKTNWGSDVELYANIRMNSTTYTKAYLSQNNNVCANSVFYENNVKTFVAENCYFFRDSEGGASDRYGKLNPMFASLGNSKRESSFRFNNCKFGYTQYDIDDEDFRSSNENITTDTSKYPQNKCGGYIYITLCNNISFNKCIFNWVRSSIGSNSYYTYFNSSNIIRVKQFEYASMNDCVINKLYNGYDDGEVTNSSASELSNQGIYFSSDSNGDTGNDKTYGNKGEIIIKNFIINHIITNMDAGYCSNILRISSRKMDIENIKINILGMQNANQSFKWLTYNDSYYYNSPSYYNMVNISGEAATSMKIKNIDADFTKNSFTQNLGYTPNIINIYNMQQQVGNISNEIKNINIKLNKISSHTSRTVQHYACIISNSNYEYYYSGTNYSITSNSNNNIARAWIIENVNVDVPYGKALSLTRNAMKTQYLNGYVYLSNSILEVDKIHNDRSNNVNVSINGITYLKCNEYEIDLSSNEFPYTGNIQFNIDNMMYPSSVYVGQTNAILFDESQSTELQSPAQTNSLYICPNYLLSGQLFAKNNNCIAKSWNVTRTGSTSDASIRFQNNLCVQTNRPNKLIIGLDPYKGIEITPSTTGKKMLTCYLALKNFEDTEIVNGSKYCGISVRVPETLSEGNIMEHVYDSSSYGWKYDDSTWSNESNLKMFKICIPIEVKETNNNIDVKIWYNWFSYSGIVYVDPDIKLTDIE